MVESRMHELAEELLRRSRSRKVPWEERTRGGGYQVVFPDGALRVSVPRDASEEDAEYQLVLIGDTGSIIGSLEPSSNEPMYQTLAEIFDLAQSYVRDTGIEKALDFLKSR